MTLDKFENFKDENTYATYYNFYGYWAIPESIRDLWEHQSHAGIVGLYDTLKPNISYDEFENEIINLARYFGSRK